MKRYLSFIVTILLIFCCVGCDINNSGTNNNTASKVDVWGTSGTDKVLQNVHGIYDEIKTDAKIDIDMAKGEYESQNIIMTAGSKKVTYTIELSDLTSKNGDILSKDNITVFHEKYIKVTNDLDKSGKPVGNYPDALVPYDNIVAAQENVIEPTNNQGLYFRFYTPTEQVAGLYTGNAKLVINGETHNIPISINVRNLLVNQVNHTRSIFLTSWFTSRGELDTTQEMLNKYNRFLNEYRLCGSELVLDSRHNAQDIRYYVDLAYEFMQNPMCSTVQIPDIFSTSDVGFDADYLKKYLRAFAKKSFETNYNMMEKLVFYYLDEPQFWGGTEGLKATILVSTRYRNCISAVAEELENDSTIVSTIKDQVIASLRKIPNIITAWYEKSYEDYVDTWCPTYDYYDSEFSRSYYDNQEEKWWYGCLSPKIPYPTYHTEDSLVSARLESWMKAEYGVVGNLNWATDVYADLIDNTYIDLEDYYTGNAARISVCNGDGYLLYPGKRYGVDGPLPSIRFEAIRDGLEEYELFYNINENYKKISDTISLIDESEKFTSDKIINSITSMVYTGTRVTGNSSSYYSARNALYDLACLNENANVCIADFYDDTFGNYVFTLIAPQDTVIKQNGSVVTPIKTIGDYYKYVLSVSLSNDSNYFNITAEKEGVVSEYKQFIGGKVINNSATNVTISEFSKDGITPTCSIIDGNVVDSSLSDKLVKVELPSVTRKGQNQSFKFNGSLLTGVGSGSSKIIFHIYYDGDDDVDFILSAKYTNYVVYYDISKTKLKKGLNTIEIDLSDKNWDTIGGVDHLAVYVGGQEGEPARTIYFVDSIVYCR